MEQSVFNERLRQVLVVILIIFTGWLLIAQLFVFLPGLLGGLTLYILSRTLYFRLIYKNKWKKGLTALLFIIVFLIIIALPVWLSVNLISPKINAAFSNQEKIVQGIQAISGKIQDKTGVQLLSSENTRSIAQKISSFIPRLLNSTATVLANVLMMFFLLYYLLTGGKEVEKYLHHIIPLKPKNINTLAAETKMMIRANALGIPIICIVQGLFAALGYWIFGVNDWALWGFVTGVFAFFPLVGTMIIWVPLAGYLFMQGTNWPAIGLTIYSLVVTGNVDYIARLSLMKKMGNVHPLVTVLGVIAGLSLFGFIGLIFGPLLISYFLILLKIYVNEFGGDTTLSGTTTPPE
ncbi:MAG: AI-2E family transporter [Ferruginibacter sp.]